MTVEVRWHVDYSDWIEIWIDGRYVETARLHERPSSLRYSVAADEENCQTLASSKAVMEQLRSNSYEVALRPRSDEFLVLEEFIKLMARYLERALSQPELSKLSDFFRSYAPLRKNEIEDGLKKAIAVKGSALHLRYYLEHLEKVTQRRRK
jgi:hypothetical protein